MLVKFFDRGNKKKDNRYSTGGHSTKDYLLDDRVEQGTAKLLRGDPNETTEIISGLKFSTIYTVGCLSFSDSETERVTEAMKQEMMDDFERSLFGDFDRSRISGYWVQHTDKINPDTKKPRLELNFVFANVDLETGKNLPVYYHAIDKHRINDFKDLANLKHGLDDPTDPMRKRTTVLDELKQSKTQKEIKTTLNNIIKDKFLNHEINNRDDVINLLTSELGFEINRQSEKYISIKDGDSKIRLKGLFYEQQFKQREYIGSLTSERETTQSRDNKAGKPSINEISQRLESSINKRTQSLHERLKPRPDRTTKKPKQSKSRDFGKVQSIERPTATADRANQVRTQQQPSSDKFTHYTAQPKPSPFNQQTNNNQRKPKPTNDSRPQTMATPNDSRPSEDRVLTTTIDDIYYPHASRWTGNNANTNNMVESLQHTRMDKPSIDNHSDSNLGNILDNNQSETGRLNNERNYANDTNNVKSSIKQFTDQARQFFETVTDSAKSSYQRLSDQTSRVTESFRKYANQHTQQHRAVVSAVGTATETNQQLRTLTDRAERANRELKQTSYRTKQANNYLDEAITNKRAEQLRQEQQKQKQAELIKQQTPKPQKPQVEPTKPKAEPPKRKFRM